MKVLFITDGVPTDSYPLIGIFEFDQAKAVAELGHEVVFFGVDLRSLRRKRRWGIQHGETCGVSWYSIAVPVGAVSLQMFCQIGGLALNYLYNKVFRGQSKPDIIHAHFTQPGCMAARLARKEEIPLVITEHSSLMNQGEVRPSLKKCAMEGYYTAKRVIAVSEALKKNLYRHTGIFSEVIPNIASLEEFTLKQQSHHGFGFISTGNLVAGKRHQMLLEAFANISKIYDDVFLGIIGDGELKNNLEIRVRELRLEDKVIFYGQRSRGEIAEIYQQYDCFVLPSVSETFGVAYIEAMASGLPVIATKCGGPESFVNDDVGILISVDHEIELENGMIFMYENITKYCASDISEYIRMHFSAEKISEKIISVYKAVLKNEEI